MTASVRIASTLVLTTVALMTDVACSRSDATAPPVAAREDAPKTEAAEPAHAEPPLKGASEPSTTEPGPAAVDENDAPPTEDPASPPPTPSRSIDDAKGTAAADLVAAHGEPDEKHGDRWIYRYPRDAGCVDREIVYALTVKSGRVTDVARTTRQTGKHCERPDMP